VAPSRMSSTRCKLRVTFCKAVTCLTNQNTCRFVIKERRKSQKIASAPVSSLPEPSAAQVRQSRFRWYVRRPPLSLRHSSKLQPTSKTLQQPHTYSPTAAFRSLKSRIHHITFKMALKRINKELTDLGRCVSPTGFAAVCSHDTIE
jgi:hypothetical protein